MKRKLTAGITSVSLAIFVQDTSSTTGGGLGSLTHATSGLIAEYRRQGQSSWTTITLSAGTLGTYSSGGWVADGGLTGAYEVGIPDAAFAAGARMVLIRFRGAANMLPVLIEIELDAVNYQDATAFGLSRLDAAVSSRLASASYTAPLNSTQTASAVWDALLASYTVSGSFGARVVRSINTNNSVQITGSNHVAADIHELQAGVISSTDFAAGAIDANALAADAATEIATAVAATQALSRLDSMIESDGAGQFRFDSIAVSLASGGGSTDWTANERTAIRSIFGFDSGGTVSLPTVGVMDAIKDKTDLITVGAVEYTSPVSPVGNIATPIFAGDDFKASIGNAFTWTINARTGYSVSTATCRFGGSSEDTGDSWNVSGTVSDLGGGQWQLSFDLPKATTSTLSPGFYRWSVELANPGGDEVTEVYNSTANRLVEVRAKQT